MKRPPRAHYLGHFYVSKYNIKFFLSKDDYNSTNMKSALSAFGEKKLLLSLRKFLGKSRGIIRTFSEDCAVIDSGRGNCMLLTTDIQLDSVHFKSKYMPPYYLGKKALKVNLSDISAMGGKPLYYLVSLGAPATTRLGTIHQIYRGMRAAARKHGIALIGGNVTVSPLLFLDITMIGIVRRRHALFRSGAKSGDLIYVTGPLGVSAEGLLLLKNGFRLNRGNSRVRQAILKHFDPPDLNQFARALARSELANCMIDLSDGLASDLAEICRESKVGATIQLDRVPLRAQVGRKAGSKQIDLAIHGGEDYHLLFTVSPDRVPRLLRLAAKNRTRLFEIGKIVHAGGIQAIDSKGRQSLLSGGYQHFQ